MIAFTLRPPPPLRTIRGLTGATLAFLAIQGGPPARADATPPHRTIVMDARAFTHSKNWEWVSGRHDGRLDGTSLRSFHPGAHAALVFDGTKVRLFGILGETGGLAVVTLDRRVAYVVTFYAAHKRTHQLVFASKTLPPGQHRLTIDVVRMPRNPTLSPGYVNIDAAKIDS